MKLIWAGHIFNPSGIATAGREMVKALSKLGHQVQVTDLWHDSYDFNKDLEHLNNPINVKDADATIFWDYPHNWKVEPRGKIVAGFVHEGTKLWPRWSDILNTADVVWCPSNATKNLFKWNGVNKKIQVVPHGVDFDLYKPNNESKDGTFIFLSINSWTGKEGDRKGTDLLVKAFDEEFKDEDVRLVLKVTTPWMPEYDVGKAVYDILGHTNEKILYNNKLASEEELVNYYNKSHVFVMPTRGEGFGMTALNSLACEVPLIITKDNNSGHMDFCKNNPAVLFVDSPTIKQGDPQFYVPGNMLAEPDINSLRKQMRWAYENRNALPEMGKRGREFIKDFTWENSAKKLSEAIS